MPTTPDKDDDASTMRLRRVDAARPNSRPPRGSTAKLTIGVVLLMAVFALGLLTKLPAVTQLDLRVDSYIAGHDRSVIVTGIASTLTVSATPTIVGIGAAVVLPIILMLAGRKLDAVRTLCSIGGALALAVAAKALIGEPRPPRSLWAIPADSGSSYPSGHTTVAAAIAVAAVLVASRRAWRVPLMIVTGLYAVGVAASRVYLANHYPPDVVASVLVAIATGFLVAGLTSLPTVAARMAHR